jgi:acyl-CoA thioester hydrolase
MTTFRFSCPIKVRYADLDAQGHVNNAAYFSYMEQARFEYMQALGVWRPGDDFLSLGTILAEAGCTYKKPIQIGQTVEVGVRITRLGNKSYDTEYRLTVNGEEVATGRSVQVAYDYRTQRSVRIPDEWREKIRALENNPDL